MSIQEYGPETTKKQFETKLMEKNLRANDVGEATLASVLPFTDYARHVVALELSDCEIELADLDSQVNALQKRQREHLEDIAICTGADEGDLRYVPSHEDQLVIETSDQRRQYLHMRKTELQSRLNALRIMDVRDEEAQDDFYTSYY